MKNIEFHCHTDLSHDCDISIDHRITEYTKLGYDTLYLTDHDQVQNKKRIFVSNKLNPKIKLIGGIEVSTYFGHIILLNCYSKPLFNSILYLVLISRIFGYDIVIPHPWRKNTGIFYQFRVSKAPYWILNKLLKNAKYLEVYNHKEGKIDEMILPINMKDLIEKLVKVSASDSHYINDIYEVPCTEIGLKNDNELVNNFYSKLRFDESINRKVRIRTFLGLIRSNINYLVFR